MAMLPLPREVKYRTDQLRGIASPTGLYIPDLWFYLRNSQCLMSSGLNNVFPPILTPKPSSCIQEK